MPIPPRIPTYWDNILHKTVQNSSGANILYGTVTGDTSVTVPTADAVVACGFYNGVEVRLIQRSTATVHATSERYRGAAADITRTCYYVSMYGPIPYLLVDPSHLSHVVHVQITASVQWLWEADGPLPAGLPPLPQMQVGSTCGFSHFVQFYGNGPGGVDGYGNPRGTPLKEAINAFYSGSAHSNYNVASLRWSKVVSVRVIECASLYELVYADIPSLTVVFDCTVLPAAGSNVLASRAGHVVEREEKYGYSLAPYRGSRASYALPPIHPTLAGAIRACFPAYTQAVAESEATFLLGKTSSPPPVLLIDSPPSSDADITARSFLVFYTPEGMSVRWISDSTNYIRTLDSLSSIAALMPGEMQPEYPLTPSFSGSIATPIASTASSFMQGDTVYLSRTVLFGNSTNTPPAPTASIGIIYMGERTPAANYDAAGSEVYKKDRDALYRNLPDTKKIYATDHPPALGYPSDRCSFRRQ